MSDWVLMPPGSLVVLLAVAVACFWRFPRLSRWLTGLSALLLYLASTPLVASLLIGALQLYPPVSPAQIEAFRPEAIAVLAAGRRSSAPEYGGQTVDSLSLERLRYAAQLQQRLGLPLFAAGGREDEVGVSLAELMRTALETEFGVPVAAIEERSRTTAENARLLSAVLRDWGMSRILLVTHAWHMPRAKRAFERAGITVLPAPTNFANLDFGELVPGDFLPNAVALTQTSYALHEIIGLAWYELRYGSPESAARFVGS